VSEVHLLVLSTADWDNPTWTNKQHLAVRLADWFDVSYVESLGLRRPTLSSTDLRRLATRARRGMRASLAPSAVPPPPNLRVISPLVVPLHGVGPAKAWNRRTLHRAVATWAQARRRVLWTFSPVTYGLERLAHGAVYHAVDLIHTQPGFEPNIILQAERALAESGVLAIGSSRPVVSHLRSQGFKEVELWENVADTLLFAAAAQRDRPAGRVVFAGNLTPTKIDLTALLAVAELPGADLHVAGPSRIDGTGDEIVGALAASGATLHGVLRPGDLARLVGSASVGLIPYRRNGYTDGVFPMKLYEYLAAGCRVVTTRLPALERLVLPGLVRADGGDAFAAVVADHLRPPSAGEIDERQAAARGQSWESRIAQARDLVSELAAGSDPGSPAGPPVI
jgi:teichuronic acid biosynthesis glycosyltransferase TuaH